MSAQSISNPRTSKNKIQTQKGSNERLFQHGHTVCKFSGKPPLSSHKRTLKQQINGQKRREKKDLSCLVEFFNLHTVFVLK